MKILNETIEIEDGLLSDVNNIFSYYHEDNEEKLFDVIHLYPEEECNKENDGIVNYRHFILIGFNTKTKTWKNLGWYDNLLYDIPSKFSEIKQIAIFADRSTLIAFKKPVEISGYSRTIFI